MGKKFKFNDCDALRSLKQYLKTRPSLSQMKNLLQSTSKTILDSDGKLLLKLLLIDNGVLKSEIKILDMSVPRAVWRIDGELIGAFKIDTYGTDTEKNFLWSLPFVKYIHDSFLNEDPTGLLFKKHIQEISTVLL